MEKLSEILIEMIRSALAWEEANGEPCDKLLLTPIHREYTMPKGKMETENDEHPHSQPKQPNDNL